MIKRSTLALAIAIAAPLALATAEQAAAAPALSSSSALKSSSASVVTDVQYVYDFGPYGYRPVYKYRGYTYWYPVLPYPESPIGTGEGTFVAALRFAPPLTKVLAASHNARRKRPLPAALLAFVLLCSGSSMAGF